MYVCMYVCSWPHHPAGVEEMVLEDSGEVTVTEGHNVRHLARVVLPVYACMYLSEIAVTGRDYVNTIAGLSCECVSE
jgi:hypothetical protein